MIATWEIAVLILCFIGAAFYAGMETGVVSVNRLRLHHLVRRNIKGARIIQEFLDEPDHLLGTTLVGTNICHVAVSVTAASIATALLGTRGLWVASPIVTLALLIGGEYLPKAWFRSYPAYRVIPFARLLLISRYVFYPVGMAVTTLARYVVPAPDPDKKKQEPFITREEIMHLTRESEQAGSFSADERRMIHGVLELTRKPCGKIMIPRDRMTAVRADAPTDEVIELARSKGFSRLPVFNESENRYIGVVHIRDVLTDSQQSKKTASDHVRPPQIVPASMPADQLLPRMQKTRQPMALVADDRDEIIGLVTIEDVLEEIVGKL